MDIYLYNKILINDNVRIKAFNSLVINSNINNLTDTCRILLPLKNMIVKNSKTLNYLSENEDVEITIGDKITIELDHYKTFAEMQTMDLTVLPQVFIGYISQFKQNKNMIEIVCSDSMYLFKHKKIAVSSAKISLSELIDEVVEKTEIDDSSYIKKYDDEVEVDLGAFKTEGYITGGEMFSQIQDQYKSFFYFRNELIISSPNSDFITTTPNFVAGLKYPLKDIDNGYSRVIKFQYSYTTVDNDIESGGGEYYNPIIDNNLSYDDFDKENELIVIGSRTDTKSRLTHSYATIKGNTTDDIEEDIKNNLITGLEKIKDAEGKRSLAIRFNFKDIIDFTIQQYVLDRWTNYPESGFAGSFTVFGTPLVFVGDRVQLKINTGGMGTVVTEFVEETYYVDEVITSVTGTKGFIQKITIGQKTT